MSISNIEFSSPIQEYIKSIILYIGRSVDASCGDGTTTSMMVATKFMINVIEFFNCHNDLYNKLSTFEIIESFKNSIDDILDTFADKSKITVDDLIAYENISESDALKFIAHCQAYTASHGDREIAKVLES